VLIVIAALPLRSRLDAQQVSPATEIPGLSLPDALTGHPEPAGGRRER
jgi:hypothetical protein